MIVRSKPSVWQLFTIFRLSILPKIVWHLLAVAVFASLVAAAPHSQLWRVAEFYRGWTVAPFTLLGVAISIFLGFRNSACYDRWWEARRQLGALIGEMRSWARLCATLPGIEAERRVRLTREAIAYTYALMAHLRGLPTPGEVDRYAPELLRAGEVRNVPDAILRALGAECAVMLQDGEITDILYMMLDQRLNAFASFQVACERIKGTPTPFTYTLLLHRTAYAYCFLLPFGLASTMGLGTPMFCALVAYAFFGLDALGGELEEPFGPSLNALPLDAMARTVEISLLEALGEKDVPAPLQPVDAVLR